ncbi:MAG: hypothetical protein QNK65_04500 [Flavobacteriales bacterium]
MIQFSLVMGLSLAAQKIEFILAKNPNPSDLVEFKTPTYYTSLTILNHEIGLYEREAGGVFKLNENKLQCSVSQYGYSKFQESCFKISAAKKLQKSIDLGLTIQLNHLNIVEHENYNVLSFNMGLRFKRERYIVKILLKNPLNSSYIENDLEHSFSASTLYVWTKNLRSEIIFEESILYGLSITNRVMFDYNKYFYILLSHDLLLAEYNYNIGYKIKNLTLFSTYSKYPFTNSMGIRLVYAPSK